MHLNSDEKVEIFEKYGKGKTDTGSPEAQIALFSVRIAHLTEHLKSNHKDYATARALKMLVGKRRRLLDYLIRKDINRYRAIIAQKELVSVSKRNHGRRPKRLPPCFSTVFSSAMRNFRGFFVILHLVKIYTKTAKSCYFQ